MPKQRKTSSTKGNGDTASFEAKLWAAADALRNNMDAAEYKHVVLGLIFLKYISDAFEGKHAELEAQKAQGAEHRVVPHPCFRTRHASAQAHLR